MQVSAMDASASPLLSVRDLSVSFGHGDREMLAVDRVSFDIRKGETIAVVGESGLRQVGDGAGDHGAMLSRRAASRPAR